MNALFCRIGSWKCVAAHFAARRSRNSPCRCGRRRGCADSAGGTSGSGKGQGGACPSGASSRGAASSLGSNMSTWRWCCNRMAELVAQLAHKRYGATRVAHQHAVSGRVVADVGDGAARIAANVLHIAEQDAVQLPISPTVHTAYAKGTVNARQEDQRQLHRTKINRDHGTQVCTTRHEFCRIFLQASVGATIPHTHSPVSTQSKNYCVVWKVR
mmetsp:Transcript_8475/g.16005  ORF Transcript_8475/g.16005 Transcript_8475/m.16005 type:complete len:214 (+) Transcript_8475:260-901(+)